MWIISYFPELVLHLQAIIPFFGGILIYVATLLMKYVPKICYLRKPLRIAALVLIVLGIYNYGVYDTEMQWKAKLDKVQQELDEKKAQSEKTNTVIRKVYITKTQQIKNTQVVVEEKIREIEKLIDRDCRVPREAIGILNQAATYPVDSSK